jgi:hypothetical protein
LVEYANVVASSATTAGSAAFEGSRRQVVRVVAVVEAKRNPNDVGPAFVKLQQTLSFLTHTEVWNQAPSPPPRAPPPPRA